MFSQDRPSVLEALLQTLSVLGADKNGYELLFDTFVHWNAVGTRTSVVSTRQLLFRIGAVFVDVAVGCEANSDRASLIGQMLDSSNPGCATTGVPVALLDRGRNIASTSSNDNGEFQFQFAMKRNLKLAVAVDRGDPVYLPISSPLLLRSSGGSEGVKRIESRSMVTAQLT